MTDTEKIKEIKEILKEWFNDSLPDGNDYMSRVRDVIDK